MGILVFTAALFFACTPYEEPTNSYDDWSYSDNDNNNDNTGGNNGGGSINKKPPSAPTNLDALHTQTRTILTWDSVSEATKYEVYYGEALNPSRLYSLGSTTTASYIHSYPRKAFYYAVKAGNGFGWSGFSSTVYAKTY